jgi:hypothetical protein
MDPVKIKAILERQPPTNQKQVQEFLGLPKYYRRYTVKTISRKMLTQYCVTAL